jgi:hypothetical protein
MGYLDALAADGDDIPEEKVSAQPVSLGRTVRTLTIVWVSSRLPGAQAKEVVRALKSPPRRRQRAGMVNPTGSKTE